MKQLNRLSYKRHPKYVWPHVDGWSYKKLRQTLSFGVACGIYDEVHGGVVLLVEPKRREEKTQTPISTPEAAGARVRDGTTPIET